MMAGLRLLLGLLVLVAQLTPVPVQAGQRLALVVANGAYSRIAPVARAKADAEAVTTTLRDAGFQVIAKPEADTASLRKAFKNFTVALSGDDEIVIYFTGHAVNLGGEDYLLPVDTPADNEEAIKNASAPLKDMLVDFQEAKPRLLMVIVDACRPNPFPPGIGGPGLSAVTPNARQVILFSAAEGRTSLDSLGDDDIRAYSPFVRVLMKELAKPGAALPDSLRAVQTGVADLAQAAGKVQVPSVFGQIPADFQFRPAGSSGADAVSRLLAAEERQAWETVDRQRQNIGYQRFLKSFPDGPNAARAKYRLDDLAAWEQAKGGELSALRNYVKAFPDGLSIQPAREKLMEEELWERARSTNSLEAVKEYATRYRQGRYVDKAQELQSRLEAEDAAKREAGVWATAQQGNTEAAYDGYLRAYPTGRYTQHAKEAIETLVWKAAADSRNVDKARLYLARYPQGAFAAKAKEMEEDVLWEEVRSCDANDLTGSNAFRCDGLADAFVRKYGFGRYGVDAANLKQTLARTRPVREEKKALADAVASQDVDQFQAFLDRYPKSENYTMALEKLAALWQKKQPLPPTGIPFQDDFLDGKGRAPEMVALPGGKFSMGSEETGIEKPVHTVVIAHPFAIGRFEVTFDDWDACIADSGCHYKPDDNVGMFILTWKGRGKQPVINVSWNDVKQYLTWLSKKTGKTYRLLTEAEWEYAARAGTAGRYFFGDAPEELSKYAWSSANSERRAHPVGELTPSPNGLYDMYGNVSEWVQDCWHTTFDGAPINGNVAWTTNCVGSSRVKRGGFFYENASSLRSSSRGQGGEAVRMMAIGFRIARDFP